MKRTFNIPPSAWLQEARHEYSGNLNARLGIEFLQNAFDAGATEVSFTLEGKKFIVEDNGTGMDEQTMIDGLFTYCGSIKSAGSTGGYGAAKKLIVLSHKDYIVESRNIIAAGASIDYETEEAPFLKGTRITITFSDEWPCALDDLKNKIAEVVSRSTLPGKVTFNGEELPQAKLGISVSHDGAQIYEKEGQGIFVRINGLFMFYRYSSCEKGYYFDLKGKSTEILNQNREGFRQSSSAEKAFGDFTTKLAANVRQGMKAAFVKEKSTYQVIEGFVHEGDELPQLDKKKLREKNQALYSLALIVGGAVGEKVSKESFGFYYSDAYGKCEDGEKIFVNPEKHKEENWELEAITTLVHEFSHRFKDHRHHDDHDEYFVAQMENRFVNLIHWCLENKMSFSKLRAMIAERKARVFQPASVQPKFNYAEADLGDDFGG